MRDVRLLIMLHVRDVRRRFVVRDVLRMRRLVVLDVVWRRVVLLDVPYGHGLLRVVVRLRELRLRLVWLRVFLRVRVFLRLWILRLREPWPVHSRAAATSWTPPKRTASALPRGSPPGQPSKPA